MKRLRHIAIAVCTAAILVLGAVPAFAAGNSTNVYTTTPSRNTSTAKYVLDKSLTGTYYVKSALNSSRYLDMDGGNRNNGGKVQIWGPTYTSAQKWTFAHRGNGIYAIYNTHSMKALQAPSTTSKSGAALQQYTYSGKKNQQWRAYTYNKKTVFVNVATGMALDVREGKTAMGTVVQQAKRTNGTAQQWTLTKQNSIPVDYIKLNKTSLNLTVGQSYKLSATYYPSLATGSKATAWRTSNAAVATVSNGNVVAKRIGTATITAWIQGKQHTCTVTVKEPPLVQGTQVYNLSGTYFVRSSVNSGSYLDMDKGYTGNGGKLQVWGRTNATAQKWQFNYLGNGLFKIVNVNSGKVLDVSGGSTANGAKVQQYTWNNTNAQKWRIYKIGNYYSFVNAGSGKALDLTNGNSAWGTTLQQWARNNNAAQRWTLETTTVPQVVRDYNDSALAQGIFNQYCNWRSARGLNKPARNAILDNYALASAKACAEACAAGGKLDHGLGIPEGNHNIFSDILQYSTWKKTPYEVIQKWEASTGHRKMMQCNNGTIDAGVAAYFDGQSRWYYVIVYNFVGCNQSGY